MTHAETDFTARAATAPDGRDHRLLILDRLRGLMVALMILDHVREFVHRDALLFQPTDLTKTNAALFATRWVTHLCAPTFVFLAGASIRLQRDRGGTDVAGFLIRRGIWLILLEVTLISAGFNFGWPYVFFQVIWAIGAGMIVLAPLLRAPPRAVLALGLVLLIALGFVPAVQTIAPGNAIELLLFRLGPTDFVPGFVAYPLLPWFAILAIGYGAGAFLAASPARIWVGSGAALLAAFVLLRVAGLGDPIPWDRSARSFLSLLNVSKYPPSPCYVLATLGVSFVLAPILLRAPARLVGPLDAFGRVPFFVYLLHIYLAHGIAVMIGITRGIPIAAFGHFLSDPSALAKAHWGVGLGAVYLVWLTVVLALWPVAVWFARVKRRGASPWLRYL